MRFTLLALFLLLISYSVSAQESQAILSIRRVVAGINADSGYKIKTLDNEDLLDKDSSEASDNGQGLKAFYKAGRLKKLVYSVGLSFAMRTYEYYFDGMNVVFIFEKEADYPERKDGIGLDNSKLIPAFERRFYIENNKIILTKTKGRQRIPESDNQRPLTLLKDLLADIKNK